MADATVAGRIGDADGQTHRALLVTIQGLRNCLDMADWLMARGDDRRASSYVVGVVDDLAPELAALAAALTRAHR